MNERQLSEEKQKSEQNEKQIQEIEETRQKLEQEISDLRQRKPQTPPLSPPNKTPGSQPQRLIIALALAPGLTTRSGGEDMKQINLPASARNLQIRLLLETAEQYQSYRATVKTVDENAVVWTSAPLKTQGKGAKKSVSLNIPANLFSRADYEILLVGVKKDGAAEEVDNYYFRVLK